MIKIILAFLFVFVVFFFGINAVRDMTGLEQWRLTKLLAYSILCAVTTTVFLTVFVILF